MISTIELQFLRLILFLICIDLVIPFKVENLLSIDLDPDTLLDPGHEHGPGDAARLVVQLAQVQVCLVLLQQQLGPGVCSARVEPEKNEK